MGDSGKITTQGARAVENILAEGTFTTLMNAQTLQNTTETNGGTDLTCDRSWIEIEIVCTKTGSPTRFQVFLNWSNDASNFYKQGQGFPTLIWYAAAASETFLVPRMGATLRVSAQAAGTASGSHYFTVTIKARARSSG